MRTILIYLFIPALLAVTACGGEDSNDPTCRLGEERRALSVLENAEPGTVVGSVSITSPTDISAEYSIVSGNDGNSFAIDNAGQITVFKNEIIDYEQRQRFNLDVKVTSADCADGSVEVVIFIVNTVDELFSMN